MAEKITTEDSRKRESEWEEELRKTKRTERFERAAVSGAAETAERGKEKTGKASGISRERTGKGIEQINKGRPAAPLAKAIELGEKKGKPEKETERGRMEPKMAPGRSEGESEIDKAGKGSDFASQLIMAQERDRQEKARGAEKAEFAADIDTGSVSKNLLKAAWRNLIPSFGTTLSYINGHFIARYIGGFEVCHFGEERPLFSPVSESKEDSQAKAVFREMTSIILMLVLDLIIFAFITALVFLIVLMLWIVTSPCEALTFLGQGVATLIGPWAQTLVKLNPISSTCDAMKWIGVVSGNPPR